MHDGYTRVQADNIIKNIQNADEFKKIQIYLNKEIEKYKNDEEANEGLKALILNFINNSENISKNDDSIVASLLDLKQIENKIIHSNNNQELNDAIKLLADNISKNEKNIKKSEYQKGLSFTASTLANKENIINELSFKDNDFNFLFAFANYQVINAKKILESIKNQNTNDLNSISQEIAKIKSGDKESKDKKINFDKSKEKIADLIQQIKKRYIEIKFAHEKAMELHEFAANIISMSLKMNNVTINNIR